MAFQSKSDMTKADRMQPGARKRARLTSAHIHGQTARVFCVELKSAPRPVQSCVSAIYKDKKD
jgi:hypothetical protein